MYNTNNDIRSLKDIPNYEFGDRYKCDRLGSVYRVYIKDDKEDLYPMRPFITRDGYVEYVLTDINKTKWHIQGQRIVAYLFIPKPNGKDYVNHKDLNRQNNKVENLEWVSHSENIKHSYDNNPFRGRRRFI
jgi:hypothetical protein